MGTTGSKLKEDDAPLGCSKLALEKAKIVAPLRGLRPIPGEKMIEACRAAGMLLGVPEGEVSYQTIRNWRQILEIKGPQGLDRKHHKNRGQTTMDPRLVRIAKGILLNPKHFSIAESHRRLGKYVRHFLNRPEDEIPTLKQVYYLWEHIPEEEKVLALEGMQAYRRKFDEAIRFEAPYSNAIWQADHHQLDIIVVDSDTGEELGRPWLTKIQDDRSRAVLGYYLSMDHPGSMAIASALYHAFLQKPQEWWVMYGLPEMIYIDNGKDWISRHIELVALSFGIKLERHEPYHPQSKGKIERLFRTLEEMCIHPLDGSVGSNIRTRPKTVTPKLTMEQVRAHIERFIRDYHERIHGSTKQKPRERWEKGLQNHQIVKDLTKIDHLLKSKPYKVQPSGIHFKNRYYRNPDGALGKYIGRYVTVFFDSRDISRIRVWGSVNPDEELQYICTAYPQSLAPTTAERAAVAEKNKGRRDATRREVRSVQAEGEVALKVLDKLNEEAAKADSTLAPTTPSPAPDQPMPTAATVPPTPARPAPTPTTPPRVRPAVSHNAPQQAEEDDEPDYEKLRRQMQRRQRQGSSI